MARIFSGKKNSAAQLERLKKQVDDAYKRDQLTAQRAKMTREARELLKIRDQMWNMSNEELIQAARRAQDVLTWKSEMQELRGIQTRTMKNTMNVIRDRRVRENSKMGQSSLINILSSHLDAIQNRETSITAAREAKKAYLSQTREYTGVKRVTMKKAKRLWDAIDQARAYMKGADWTEDPEEYRQTVDLIQEAVSEWGTLGKKHQTLDQLAEMIENSIYNMGEAITPEWYDDALKEYTRIHPKFQGPLSRQQIMQYGQAIKRLKA